MQIDAVQPEIVLRLDRHRDFFDRIDLGVASRPRMRTVGGVSFCELR